MKKAIVPDQSAEQKQAEARRKAWHLALDILGDHFTQAWTKKQEDLNIQRFCHSAENCYEKLVIWNKCKQEATMLLCVVLLLVALTYWIFPSFWAALPGFIAAIVALIGVSRFKTNLKWTKPGKTYVLVAKEWKPIRELAIQNDIVASLRWTINDQEGRALTDLGHAFRSRNGKAEAVVKYLGDMLDSKLKKLVDEVRDAERDGEASKKAAARAQFAQVHKVALALGFAAEDWGHYFEQANGVRVRLPRRSALSPA